MGAQHGPTLNSPQLRTRSPWVYHLSLFASLRLQATKSLSMLLKSCLAGKGAINPALSQESCGRLGRYRAWGCSHPGPHAGPHAGPRDLFVLKQSPYLLFFQCPLYFLVSYLHKCWGAVGCSLCSSIDRLGASPVCRGSELRSHLSYHHLENVTL